MKPITSLITIEQIESMASRSNFRYGKEIAKDGTTTTTKTNAFNIIAEVKYKNHQTRTVTLSSTPKGLKWKCTCTAKKDLFCQHAVAVCLITVTPKNTDPVV